VKKQCGVREQGEQAGRTIRLEALTIDPQATLLELVVGTGLQVLQQLLEEDRAAICGMRYRHDEARVASRGGTTPSSVVVGGRRVVVARPRVRGQDGEIGLPTWQAVTQSDPLTERAVQQAVLGVATRRYAASLEPLGPGVVTRGTSKSSVSRRWVAATAAQVAQWQARPLGDLNLAVLFLDGVRFGRECLIVALGIDTAGAKHVLGVWSGSTENATVCQALLSNLVDRGLRPDRSLLVVLDGGKALTKAVTQTFGAAAWIQRCHVHKVRNVLGYVAKAQQAWVRQRLQQALRADSAASARRQLEALARQLEARYPQAAASVREGLDELVTVLDLPVAPLLRRALVNTNTIESVIGRVRHVHRNVKRWRGTPMVLRWAVAGLAEAARGFKRIKGATDMRALVNALRARDRQLNLGGTSCAA
jgi:transposase-like protein